MPQPTQVNQESELRPDSSERLSVDQLVPDGLVDESNVEPSIPPPDEIELHLVDDESGRPTKADDASKGPANQ